MEEVEDCREESSPEHAKPTAKRTARQGKARRQGKAKGALPAERAAWKVCDLGNGHAVYTTPYSRVPFQR